MKKQCEKCGQKLKDDGEAYICSYECTYCRSCLATLEGKCPNCRGELVVRPIRKPR